MKKILVTGATGFIGNKLLDKLLSNNFEVICVVREDSKHLSNLLNKNVKIVYCNLNNYHNLPNLLNRNDIDTVYHFAWQGVSDKDLTNEHIQLNNVQSTLDLIDVCPKLGVKRFIGAGSIHEIEGYYEMLEDKVITNLGYAYKSSKLAAHWMGKALAGNKGIDFFWPIISNTYGVGENSGRLVNTIIRNILNGESTSVSEGKQNYDFVYIDDIINAFYLIGEKGINGHNYFIGSGTPKPLKEYLHIIEDIANKKNCSNIKLSYGDIKNNVVYLPEDIFDISNLIKDTNWKPIVSFEDGINKTVDWIYTQNKNG